MIIFTEWKHDAEMIEDGVLALVLEVSSEIGAAHTHSYMMLFEALDRETASGGSSAMSN